MSYFDDYAKHIIETEFHAQEQEEKYVEFMGELKQEILHTLTVFGVVSSRTRLNQLMKKVNSIIDEQIDDYFDDFEGERQEQAHEEGQFLNDFLKAALGVSIALSLSSLANVVLASFNGKDTIQSFRETLKNNLKKTVRNPLVTSLIMRTGASTVNNSVANGFDSILRKSSADVHTMVTGIQRNTQYLVIPKMGTVKVQYVSMLDDKTCSVCGSYSGTIYESEEEAPVVPIHDRCRCYLMPVTERMDEPTYEDWINSLPDSEVYKILGPARYSLWKSGISIKKFSSEGRKLTLKELYSK